MRANQGGGTETKKTAFIVEDDSECRLIFDIMLRQIGFDNRSARSGEEAVEILGDPTYCPDLVMLDLHLGLVSGVDVLRFIRSLDRLDNTRVVIATADLQLGGDLEDQVEYVLFKPIGFPMVQKAIYALWPPTWLSQLDASKRATPAAHQDKTGGGC